MQFGCLKNLVKLFLTNILTILYIEFFLCSIGLFSNANSNPETSAFIDGSVKDKPPHCPKNNLNLSRFWGVFAPDICAHKPDICIVYTVLCTVNES